MSTLVVIGATGRTGRLAVKHALAAGLKVRALCRNEAKAKALLGDDKNLTFAVGDAEKPETVRAALKDATYCACFCMGVIGEVNLVEVVVEACKAQKGFKRLVWQLGVFSLMPGEAHPQLGASTLAASAVAMAIAAASKVTLGRSGGVTSVIGIGASALASGIAALLAWVHGKPLFSLQRSAFVWLGQKVFPKDLIGEQQAGLDQMVASGLSFTYLRPFRIKDEPSKGRLTVAEGEASQPTTFDDIAAFAVATLDDPKTGKKAVWLKYA